MCFNSHQIVIMLCSSPQSVMFRVFLRHISQSTVVYIPWVRELASAVTHCLSTVVVWPLYTMITCKQCDDIWQNYSIIVVLFTHRKSQVWTFNRYQHWWRDLEWPWDAKWPLLRAISLKCRVMKCNARHVSLVIDNTVHGWWRWSRAISALAELNLRIWYDITVYMCAQKQTSSQLSLPHGTIN